MRELRGKHQVLLEELEDTKVRLMMDPSKWLGECKWRLLLLYCYFTSKPVTDLFCGKPSDKNVIVSTVEVDPTLDKESSEYLEALAQATEELEFCVNLCKSRVMMVTCFDISTPSTCVTQEGLLREVEV